MTKNHRISIILVVWIAVLAWFSISSQHLGQNTPLLMVLALAGVAPLYPLYRLAKRWPSLLVGITLVAAVGPIASAYIVAHYLLGVNSVWLERISDLNEWLLISACILLAWGGAKGG